MKRYFALIGLCSLAIVTAGCGAIAHMTATSGTPSAGKTLFTEGCSACHTLAAAGTVGTIGPNLDYAFGPDRCQGFSVSTIRDVVLGQIYYADDDPETDYPPGSANAVEGMPAEIYTGKKAEDVAAYVASVAGVTMGPGKHFDCQTGAYAG